MYARTSAIQCTFLLLSRAPKDIKLPIIWKITCLARLDSNREKEFWKKEVVSYLSVASSSFYLNLTREIFIGSSNNTYPT